LLFRFAQTCQGPQVKMRETLPTECVRGPEGGG